MSRTLPILLLALFVLSACPSDEAPADNGDAWMLNNPQNDMGATNNAPDQSLPPTDMPPPPDQGPPPGPDMNPPPGPDMNPPPGPDMDPPPVPDMDPPPGPDMNPPDMGNGMPGDVCQGNNDCGAGTLCCSDFNNLGSNICKAPMECIGMMEGVCRDDGDCANGVCCENAGVNTKTCRDSCDPGGPGPGVPMMCQTTADCTNQTCCPDMITGNSFCLDQCPMQACSVNPDCGAADLCCPMGFGGDTMCQAGPECSASSDFFMIAGLCRVDGDCRDNRTCCNIPGQSAGICQDTCGF